MANEWPLLSLRESHVVLIDCVHKTPPASDVGYPYVAIPQLRAGFIDTRDARRITEEQLAEWTRKAMPTPNDIVLSRRCNPGETAFVSQRLGAFALGQNLVLLRADGTTVYPPFLRWLARGPEWWEQIRKYLNVGAVFDSLRCADVPNFQLHIPPLDEQRAIASVLGALDDKIDLNRRMNETLEAMARALFKSWFVDFDPVRAKKGGEQPYGMDAATAALFPAAFEESALGDVPQGWRVSTIGEVTRVVGGSTPRTDEPRFWGGDVCFATPKDLSRLAHPVLLDTARHITGDGLQQISSGLLPSGTVLLSSRAPIGYLAITEVPVAVNQGFIAMPTQPDVPNLFVMEWCAANMESIKGRANGTTFMEISKAAFRPIPCIIPSPQVMRCYVDQAEPLYRRLVANVHESATLTELRDTLLPKLLSGEVRVGDAEKVPEAAT